VHHERIDSWHHGRPKFGVQILHALTRLGAKMSKHRAEGSADVIERNQCLASRVPLATTNAEARRLAATIAKLPELLKRRRPSMPLFQMHHLTGLS
jgi:hypothetical protein